MFGSGLVSTTWTTVYGSPPEAACMKKTTNAAIRMENAKTVKRPRRCQRNVHPIPGLPGQGRRNIGAFSGLPAEGTLLQMGADRSVELGVERARRDRRARHEDESGIYLMTRGMARRYCVDRALVALKHVAEHRPRHHLKDIGLRRRDVRGDSLEIGSLAKDLEELFQRQAGGPARGVRRQVPRDEGAEFLPAREVPGGVDRWRQDEHIFQKGRGRVAVVTAALAVDDIAAKPDHVAIEARQVQRYGSDLEALVDPHPVWRVGRLPGRVRMIRGNPALAIRGRYKESLELDSESTACPQDTSSGRQVDRWTPRWHRRERQD